MAVCATLEEQFQHNGAQLSPLGSLAIVETTLSQRGSWAPHNRTKA